MVALRENRVVCRSCYMDVNKRRKKQGWNEGPQAPGALLPVPHISTS